MKIGILVAAAGALAVAGHGPARRAVHALTVKAAPAATIARTLPTTIDPATILPMQVGMNTALLGNWMREEPYVDVIRTHAELWLAATNERLVDQFPLDAGGRPSSLPKGTELAVLLGPGRTMPQGADCVISPGWEVRTRVNARIEQNGTRWRFQPAMPGDNEVSFTLVAQRPGAALTQLSCHPNGMPVGQTFNPAFLHDMAPFHAIRFMNWMKANDVVPGTWDKRPTPGELSLLRRGASVEDMVAIANATHADPWFCLPFNADADYQRRFATYVRDHLAPGLKVYAELSNEVWNSQFVQGKEAIAKGKAAYPGADDAAAADYYYADRVRPMMAIWSEVFAGQPKRLVRVLGAQAAWSQRAQNALGHNETWRSVDALAIAPYFGVGIVEVPGSGTQRVNTIFQRGPALIDTAIGWAKANKLVANSYKLRLIAYEGGPSFDSYRPDTEVDQTAVQHDPRFHALYTQYLDRWRREIGDLFVAFDTTDGGWGHLWYTGQPWSEAPKMQAIVDYARKVSPKR